jgi:hypothetical protein
MTMQINRLGKFLATMGVLLALGSPGLAQAAKSPKSCTLANVAGVFGAYGSGTIQPGNTSGMPPGPFATVAIVTFDGRGGFFSKNQTAIFNGVVNRHVARQGSYSVNEDCTGELTIDNDTADMVFVDNANEIYLTDTNTGLINIFVLKRINTRRSKAPTPLQ